MINERCVPCRVEVHWLRDNVRNKKSGRLGSSRETRLTVMRYADHPSHTRKGEMCHENNGFRKIICHCNNLETVCGTHTAQMREGTSRNRYDKDF